MTESQIWMLAEILDKVCQARNLHTECRQEKDLAEESRISAKFSGKLKSVTDGLLALINDQEGE